MHLSVCSSSVSVAAATPRGENARPWCGVRRRTTVPVLQCLARPEFVRLIRVKGENNFGILRGVGISQSRVWMPLGAAELVRVTALAAAFEEGTTVDERIEKSAKGRVEGRSNSEELTPGDGDQGKSLVHELHDAARVFQSGLEKQKTLASRPWFPQKWLGRDKNAWMKSLAYQAAVHSLLQAVNEIAARGEGRDRHSRVFVQRRLMHLASPLEDSIRHELSSRDPAADDWLWLQQQPLAVAKFVRLLEKDNRFKTITSTDDASNLSTGSDVELLKLAISSTAALLMLGSAAVSNPIFSLTLPKEMRHLMEKLLECIRMDQVYLFCSGVGLKHEFLDCFGTRAADDKKWQDEREGGFWIYLVQDLLRGALVREGVRSRLKPQVPVEVLERDLAVLGFFATLGRSTRAYLAAKGVSDSEESLASLLRYLEGGSVLFYPQLATLSIYQLFIEVVCEEMEWLPFYPSSPSVLAHEAHGESGKVKTGIGKAEKLLAIAVAVQVCSLWVNNFSQHSVWVRQPEGFRAATFLSKSQQRLEECNEAYELVKRSTKYDSSWKGESKGEKLNRLMYQELRERSSEEATSSGTISEGKSWDWSVSDTEASSVNDKLAREQRSLQEVEQQLKSIDKELQSVEIAVAKLELLVKESEISGLSGKERVCANLDKIRSLKREVEVLEASFKAKATAKEERILELQVEQERVTRRLFQQPQSSSAQDRHATPEDRSPQMQRRRRTSGEQSMVTNEFDEGVYDEKVAEAAMEEAGAISKDAKTFEQLLKELAELESRIQQSASESASVRSLSQEEWERASVFEVASTSALARLDENLDMELAGEYGGFFSKSIEKLKDASVDIWRGSCLLGTDVAAALVILRRNALGQRLTSREQKILKRTLTDLASVIPIGFLMLLPVTAVGHAAILAAIQKYVPALIPSAYGPERLDVLRRLEQLRQMEPESIEKPALSTPRKLERSS